MLTDSTTASCRDAPGPYVGVNRRFGVGLDLLVAVVLLLLAMTLFSEAVLQPGQVPFGLDLVQHYSREVFNRRALQQTYVPLWNPYDFSGFPVQADPQTGVFYPPSMLLRLFGVPVFLTWTVVFHLWLFGFGGYALCRTLGVGRTAAALGGASLLLGGIMMPRVYAGHLDVIRTIAWVPLALTAVTRSLDRDEIRPTAFAVSVLSLELLAGFLQLTVYTLGVVAFYAVFSASWPVAGTPTWRRTCRIAMQSGLLVVLVLGVTAFQFLPTARLIMTAGRTGGMPYGAAVDEPLLLRDLPAAMFTPERRGTHDLRWVVAGCVGALGIDCGSPSKASRVHWRSRRGRIGTRDGKSVVQASLSCFPYVSHSRAVLRLLGDCSSGVGCGRY